MIDTTILVNAFESLRKREGDYLPLIKLIFFETLKKKYPTKLLSELLIESKGGSWGNFYFKDSIKAKVLRSPDIRFGFIDFENAEERFFTEKEIQNFNLTNNDILVIKSNGSLDLVGKSQIFKSNKNYPNIIASNFLMVLTPNTKKVYPEYLDLFLKSPQSLIWRFDKQKTSTGLRNLKSSEYLKNEIPIPNTIEEQKELFNIFQKYTEGKFDDKDDIFQRAFKITNDKEEIISELTTQQTLITQLRQSILQEAVQGKLVKQNRNDEPASELLKRIKAEKEKLIKQGKLKKEKPITSITEDETLFALPENWVWCRVGEVLEILTDYHANGAYEKLKSNVELLDIEDYAIMLRTTNFHPKNYFEYKYITKEAYNFLKKSKVYAGDIIMNKIGDPGSVFFVQERGKPMSLAMNLFLLRFSSHIENMYAYFYLKLKQDYIKTFAAGTSSLTITKDAVKNILFPLPPLPEQKRIVEKVNQLMQHCNELEQQVQQSITHAQQLMQAVLREVFEKKEKKYQEAKTSLSMAAEK